VAEAVVYDHSPLSDFLAEVDDGEGEIRQEGVLDNEVGKRYEGLWEWGRENNEEDPGHVDVTNGGDRSRDRDGDGDAENQKEDPDRYHEGGDANSTLVLRHLWRRRRRLRRYIGARVALWDFVELWMTQSSVLQSFSSRLTSLILTSPLIVSPLPPLDYSRFPRIARMLPTSTDTGTTMSSQGDSFYHSYVPDDALIVPPSEESKMLSSPDGPSLLFSIPAWISIALVYLFNFMMSIAIMLATSSMFSCNDPVRSSPP